MLLEGNGTRAHGRNENVEKSRSGKYTFLPIFSHFPRMQSIRPAVFHTAQPVGGRQCRSQFAILQSAFANEFLRAISFSDIFCTTHLKGLQLICTISSVACAICTEGRYRHLKNYYKKRGLNALFFITTQKLIS